MYELFDFVEKEEFIYCLNEYTGVLSKKEFLKIKKQDISIYMEVLK